MKKKLALIPLLSFVTLVSVSCEKNQQNKEEKYTISYGSMFDEEMIDINTYAELETKVTIDEETFLVAFHYGSDPACGCWMNFKNQINKFIKSSHVRVYKFDSFKLKDNNEYGFIPLEKDEPSLYLVSGGKIIKKYQYGDKKLEKFFSDMEVIKKELNNVINYPNYYYVNEAYLDEKLIQNPVEKAAVFFMRSKCPDCSYCLPNFMLPYGEKNQLNVKVWLMDLQEVYETEKETTYVQIKNKYGLTEEANATYGYGNGVVPTTQYYENGVLKDASVYFNDTVEKVNDKYVITNSYYSNDRRENLHYLSNLNLAMLKGMEIAEKDLVIDENYIMWNQNSASIYHNQILTAFYDYYLK